MSWGAQNRSKDAKTLSVGRGTSEKPELDLWPIQQYLGLIAPAGHGARRACVNRAAPSGWQWAPRRPGGAPGVHKKKRVPTTGAAIARPGVHLRPSWHRIFNDLVPLTHGG